MSKAIAAAKGEANALGVPDGSPKAVQVIRAVED